MNSEEQILIDGLFSRLQEAERQSAPRDALAEEKINQHLSHQPAAPYYMAQAILIQEAAITRLDQRVKELEAQAAEQQNPPSSGGFLAGLFGGGQRDATPQASTRPAGWGETRFSQSAAAQSASLNTPQTAAQATTPAQGSGFMRGALQTAAGVAGGMVVGDLLTSMFHHNQPQEIVEVIHEDVPVLSDSTADTGLNDDTFAGVEEIDTDAFDSSDFFDDDSMFS